jgi:hypothetical protein
VRSRGIVSLLVVGGALLAAPGAQAATLAVDDDGQDCPAAAFTSVQAAIDAAAAGDTVAICPGTYPEGTGQAGTNALTIAKSLTLRGAGADRVRISPRRLQPSGNQIADAELDIADGVGDIVAVRGQPAAPITVDISGVTVDGNGVYVEAGVVYIDAQGTISRSRVTNVVTTEQATGHFAPGGWRDTFPGYGIAQVTAATGAPAGATPRALNVENTRVDRYNAAGLFVAGLPDLGGALVDNRAVVNASEIVGRILCQNFAANGNCSAPGLVTSGPLFGQDGVHVTGQARATVQNSMVTSNLVNGTGAPVRNAATGNDNLTAGAGVRLVGADAANSLITKNNIVDNAYGVYNVEADGTTPSAVPVPAPMNWWGLRFTPLTPNSGPAVSPTSNPPIPENPVNEAVDFMPFRAGAQSDPHAGQYTNIQAPMPADDAAPSVAVAADATSVNRGQTITLTADAADDFGVREVAFFDGGTSLGVDSTPPYTQTFTVPADAPCAARMLSAVAGDSLGQTADASVTIAVVGPFDCGPAPEPPPPPSPPPGPPSGSLPHTLNRLAQGGTDVLVTATADAGVAKVEYFLGDRLVCTLTAAPYSCRVVPRPADVGLQSLRVVITDARGVSTVVSRQLLVDRFAARGVRAAVKEKRRPRGREKRTIVATVRPPAGTTAAEVCADGSLTFVVDRKGRSFLNRQVELRDDCTARLSFTAKRARKRIHSVSARFVGNTVLLPARTTRRFS